MADVNYQAGAHSTKKRSLQESADRHEGGIKRTKLLSREKPLGSGHTFHTINVSGNARAIFGNVEATGHDALNCVSADERRQLVLRSLYYEDMQSRREQLDLGGGSS